MTLRAGDRIRAIPGSVSELFSEGRCGTVAEIRDPRVYSTNDSNNLVRWDGDQILLGFRPNEVEKID